MGWVLWVKLLPPLRICWNETVLMLKALWVCQHCADKPKYLVLCDHPCDIWPTLDLWCQRLDQRTWWKVPPPSQFPSSSSPPSLPSILQISSSQHLQGQTGRSPNIELIMIFNSTMRRWCTCPQMVMAGYSNPAMSFPVVSKDVITGWFSQLLQSTNTLFR